MTRSEAFAPLGKGEGRFPATASMLYRSRLRKAAIAAMVDFYEDKGWFESNFIFRGPAKRVEILFNFLKNDV